MLNGKLEQPEDVNGTTPNAKRITTQPVVVVGPGEVHMEL